MNKTKTPEKIPKTWSGLQARYYSLRPIHSESDYDKAVNAAGFLAGHEDLTDIQQDYLEILGMIIGAYEDQHHKFDTSGISQIEVLEFILEQNGMNASDLGRLLGDRSLGSRILNGKRQLSKKHIAILAEHFAVDPALFLLPAKDKVKNSRRSA